MICCGPEFPLMEFDIINLIIGGWTTLTGNYNQVCFNIDRNKWGCGGWARLTRKI